MNEFVSQNHEVCVVTGLPNYPSGKIEIKTGTGHTVSSGDIYVETGDSLLGSAGNITIRSGDTFKSFESGAINILGGANSEGNGATGGNIFLQGGTVTNATALRAGNVVIQGGLSLHSVDVGKSKGFGGNVEIHGGASKEGIGGDVKVESGVGTKRSGEIQIKSQTGDKNTSLGNDGASGKVTVGSGDSYASGDAVSGEVQILSGSVLNNEDNLFDCYSLQSYFPKCSNNPCSFIREYV